MTQSSFYGDTPNYATDYPTQNDGNTNPVAGDTPAPGSFYPNGGNYVPLAEGATLLAELQALEAQTESNATNAANSATAAAASAAAAAAASSGSAGTATPLVDGTAAVGTSSKWAHEDHRHPTDTSRADAAATTSALALKAPLASPALTGTPTAPTATVGTNTTQLATTAFVLANAGPGGGIPSPQGRLTLVTGTPVMTSTQSAQSTVYYTPAVGGYVPLYNGTSFTATAFSEISQAVSDATKSPAAAVGSSVYDVFVWNDSGTLRATRGPAWTNDTTRSAGTALVRVNGILLNNASITNGPAASRGTYVGTIRTNAAGSVDFIFGGSASGGTAGFFGVWNMYNRVDVATDVVDSGASYTYTTSTVRQARASAGNQVSFVLGLQEDSVFATYTQRIDFVATALAFAKISVQIDDTTTHGGMPAFFNNPVAAAFIVAPTAAKNFYPGIGMHKISANESGDTNNNTFNNNSIATLSVRLRN